MTEVLMERFGQGAEASAEITLNRPEKGNALTLAMLRQLDAYVRELETDRAVRVVLLRGRGRFFSTGGDIEAWGGLAPHQMARDWILPGIDVFTRIAALPQPVIAVLNGHALGGGLELALAADLRIAVHSAKLGTPEVTLGMISGWMGVSRLAETIGVARADRIRASRPRLPGQAPVKPRLGEFQIAVDRGPGDVHQLRGFLVRAAEKESQLDDPHLAFIHRLQLIEGRVKRQHLFAGRIHPGHLFMQRHPFGGGRTLQRFRLARIIDQNHAHQLRREGEKMPPVLERRAPYLRQLEVQLVHQAGGLQSVAAPSSLEISQRDGAQVVIGQRHQLLERFPIAFVPPVQQLRDLARDRGRHVCLFYENVRRPAKLFLPSRLTAFPSRCLQPTHKRTSLKMLRRSSFMIPRHTESALLNRCFVIWSGWKR
jgi:Enoyl-CoA hydratase/isomerase